MRELLKDVEPWNEDLSRASTAMDKVDFSHEYDFFLGQTGPLHCKFPWCEDVRVDRRFWESLVCLDPRRQGWVMDEHIELLVRYMWHLRLENAKWAMVSSYFVQLLLQGSMPLWYADGKTYNIPWSAVDQVIIPINEPLKHWLVAQLDIRTCVVTFYDSGGTCKTKWCEWYVTLRNCLKVKLPKVLKKMNVFQKKGIDPTRYTVSFENVERVPKQGGVFGDCGIWACFFYTSCRTASLWIWKILFRLPFHIGNNLLGFISGAKLLPGSL